MSNLRTALGEGTAEHSQHPRVAFTFGDSWQAEKLHRQAALSGCLERVSHTAGCKNNFLSLMTNLKRGTLDMCTGTARMCARSGDLKLGNVHLGWCAHSWLVCAAVGADFFFFFCNAKMADLESDHFVWNRNWPRFCGYTQSLQLIQVIQELTFERNSLTASRRFVSQRKNKKQKNPPL